MDTYQFRERWHARIPVSWPMEATWQADEPETFAAVNGLTIVFLPGMKARGIPEADARRMVEQGLIEKIGE